MGIAENIASIRRFYEAGPATDDSGRRAFAAPSITWHVPGANRVSGEYRGLDAVFRDMGERMRPLDRWVIEPVRIMGNGDLVLAVVSLSASRYGRSLDTAGAHVFRFDAGGLVVEAWGFVEDQGALDELLDPA